MSRTTTFRDSQEYVDFVDKFLEAKVKGVQVEANGAESREDAAVFRMVIHLRNDPVEVIMQKGRIYLVRTD
jgi:hypothetical protein